MPIDFANELNPAQLEAATYMDGPVLVIAGAGSGKTRTIVYRLAHLVEQGHRPESILLLTFTRKAAAEMLARAGQLLADDQGLPISLPVSGGTFHSFAHTSLRRYGVPGMGQSFTILDRSDCEAIIRNAKADLKLGKGDRSFPKIRTVVEQLSKARNKELSLEDILQSESPHLLAYADDFHTLGKAYEKAKERHGLLDYDDLLFKLETLILERPEIKDILRARFSHIMVDEYQDTNLIQARIVRHVARDNGPVMAVGDDAQSIYGFRGANVENIHRFPDLFPGTRIIKLEQNYRSTQPILSVTNSILSQSNAHFKKELFSDIASGPRPRLVKVRSDRTQADAVVNTLVKLLKKYDPADVAVLIRAGYMSFRIESLLNRLGIRFAKYGGIRFTDAAHIKDALAYARLVVNAHDLPAWHRVTATVKGVGPKTAARLFEAIHDGNTKYLASSRKRWPEVDRILVFLSTLRDEVLSPLLLMERINDFYGPIMENLFPDDHPKRRKGLEELLQMAAGYEDVQSMLSDLSLEAPESADDEEPQDRVVLSTIHSAKGLEWEAVLLIDLVEDRFPSRHALTRADEFEEERRLMYVACTRAKRELYLFVPSSVYRPGADWAEPAVASPFVRDLPSGQVDELGETFSGQLAPRTPSPATAPEVRTPPAAPGTDGKQGLTRFSRCSHKIFGNGTIVDVLPGGKYRVNFPGFGLKVILADYLELLP